MTPDAVLDRGLGDRDGLEAALERAVLLDVLAVLGEGRRADDLDLAAREGGLEDVGGVHAALRVARADEVVHLVDDEDDVALAADLFDEALHAALELAAELRPGDEGREVEQIDLLVFQLVWHLAVGDVLGQALGDGGLSDARLADEAGVVLLAAVEDLHDALELLGAADHPVELAVAGALREVDAVAVEEFVLAARRVLAVAARCGAGLRVLVLALGAAEEAVEEGEGRGLAVVVAAALVVGGHQLLRAGERAEHIAREAVELLVAQAHLLDHVVDGLDVQLARALEAEPLVFGLSVFDFGDKDYRHVLAAAGAHGRLHRVPSLGS